MGIFNRRGGEKASRSQESARGNTGWENMNVPNQNAEAERKQEAERKSADRQQRKIIAMLDASRDGGFVDTRMLSQSDAEVSDGQREGVLERMADGRITDAQKRQIIDDIRGLIQFKGGAEKVMDGMTEKHERRILSSMSGRGFDSWQVADTVDLTEFVRKYPNPADFERDSNAFLDMIESGNGAGKRREYEEAMDSFKHRVYGKKYEYWNQIRVLEKESEQKRIIRQMGTRSRRVTEVEQRRPRHMVEAEQPQSNRSEYERSSEWARIDAGYWQASRSQAARGEVTRENIERGLWADNMCEDSVFYRPEQKMFGVFDGAGGEKGGRLASQLTSSVVREFSDRYALDNCSSLAYVLNAANERVTNNPDAGLSTAVLAKIIDRNGRKMLAYASVGDSRLYIIDKNGEARQITRDEGEGKYIYNAIGMETKPGESRTTQMGEVDLRRGDKIVLCSDGVTGDYGDDLMSPRELGFIVSHSNGSIEASKSLLANARKRDDRTAIVIGEYD